MPEQDYSLRPAERMKLRKNIETLFQKGEAFSFPPFRVIHLQAAPEAATGYPVRIGVSIPKRRFKKAAERNLLKRRIKEAWRLSKADMYKALEENPPVHCFLIYQSSKLLTFATIQAAVNKVQAKLAGIYSSHS